MQIIVIDPPWNAKDQLTMSKVKRGAASNYTTLSTDDLCELPIKDLADPEGCVIAIWALNSMIEDAIRLMNAWGFKTKQIFTWVKTVKKPKGTLSDEDLMCGLGRMFRASSELCLIGINTTKIYKKLENKSQRSVCFETTHNKAHSEKPEILQDRLEKMFPGPFSEGKALEIFARRQRNGWICVGNEAPNTLGEDIRVSLNKLLEKEKAA